MNIIPIADMEDRRIYRIQSRNLVVGAWRAKTRGFVGIRMKFGELYLFEEYHYEIGTPYGTVRPLEALDFVPDGIEVSEFLKDGYKLTRNDDLFEFLKPLDTEINRQRAEERRVQAQEAESKRWAPLMRKQWEMEQRVTEVRAWAEGQRAQGRKLRDFLDEYQDRMRTARREDA